MTEFRHWRRAATLCLAAAAIVASLPAARRNPRCKPRRNPGRPNRSRSSWRRRRQRPRRHRAHRQPIAGQEQAGRTDLCRQFPRLAAEHDRGDVCEPRRHQARRSSRIPARRRRSTTCWVAGCRSWWRGSRRSPARCSRTRSRRSPSPRRSRLANFPDLPTAAENRFRAISRAAGRRSRARRHTGRRGAQGECGLAHGARQPEVQSRLEKLATYVRHLSPARDPRIHPRRAAAWRPVVRQFGVTTP